jgi:twinkle protein
LSEWVAKESCPSCGSRDNLARHSDGHAYCFSVGCGYFEKGDGETVQQRRPRDVTLIDGNVSALLKRGINEETCRHWRYETGMYGGKPVQIANYCDASGQPVAQKLRFADKTFTIAGNMKAAMPLYGQWLWRDSGRMVVVTEGEIDALSVSQLQGNKWPVVSIPQGAQSAASAFRKAITYLEQFDSVVICFDQDEAGRQAAKDCAELLTPGKAKIVTLPLKDANDMLVAGRGKELIDALWSAKTYRPDGIVNASETWDRVNAYMTATHDLPQFPWPGINDILKGLWPARIMLITAGTGIGKSTICGELAYHLLRTRPEDENIGYIALEETVEESDLRFMSLAANKPLLVNNNLSQDQLKAAFDETLGTGRLYLYDHFGSLDGDNLVAKIKYLAISCNCRFIFLDHVSIVVSGNEEITDERRSIDLLMTKLRSLVGELQDTSLIVVSHLKRSAGKSHEEGGQVSLSDLRGSQSLAQLSDVVLAGERDQQCEDNPNLIRLRVLKNRPAGKTGLADALQYIPETGRLVLYENDFTR